ncbi:hypothetical protein Tco_0549579 [Tanacetum coccineum]
MSNLGMFRVRHLIGAEIAIYIIARKIVELQCHELRKRNQGFVMFAFVVSSREVYMFVIVAEDKNKDDKVLVFLQEDSGKDYCTTLSTSRTGIAVLLVTGFAVILAIGYAASKVQLDTQLSSLTGYAASFQASSDS